MSTIITMEILDETFIHYLEEMELDGPDGEVIARDIDEIEELSKDNIIAWANRTVLDGIIAKPRHMERVMVLTTSMTWNDEFSSFQISGSKRTRND